MHTMRGHVGSGVALLALSGLLAGCGAEVEEPVSQLEQRQGAQALDCAANDTCCDPRLYDSCRSATYGPGNNSTIRFKYYSCLTSAQSTAPTVFCQVESPFYAIGGGAATLGSADAALTYSFGAVGINSGWVAGSQGILAPVSHSLKAYAIGIRVYDSSNRPVDLTNDIHSYFATSSAGTQVTAYASVAAGELLVGGGFSAENAGMFPVDAYAHSILSGQWQVNGRQFGTTAGKITAMAAGLSRCLPSAHPLFCFAHRDITQATSSDGTFLQGVVTNNHHSGSAVVGVGAISSSWARPIWELYPLAPDFDLSSTNTFGSGVAFTTAPTRDLGHVTGQIITIGF